MSIKWTRPDDGFLASKCGRFEIEPIFIGRTTAQGYVLYLIINDQSRERVASGCNTQSEAKARADRFVRLGR